MLLILALSLTSCVKSEIYFILVCLSSFLKEGTKAILIFLRLKYRFYYRIYVSILECLKDETLFSKFNKIQTLINLCDILF